MKKQRRKAYTDILGKPLTADDVALAVRAICQFNTAATMNIARRTGLGYGKISRIMDVLETANVVSLTNSDNQRTILLRSEPAALNAALRQLRKGNS